MRRDFCKLCTAAEGQSWVFRRMLISTCGETTRGWQRTIWKDLPYQCPTFTYGWTQPILTSQTRKLKLHRAFSWIVRKVLPQRYEKISPRLSLVLRSPEMSEKQEPKESNCFQVNLKQLRFNFENNFRGQNIALKKNTYIVWHQIKIYQEFR